MLTHDYAKMVGVKLAEVFKWEHPEFERVFDHTRVIDETEPDAVDVHPLEGVEPAPADWFDPEPVRSFHVQCPSCGWMFLYAGIHGKKRPCCPNCFLVEIEGGNLFKQVAGW